MRFLTAFLTTLLTATAAVAHGNHEPATGLLHAVIHAFGGVGPFAAVLGVVLLLGFGLARVIANARKR